MTANKHASRPSLGSDLARVARHVAQRDGCDELPELTEQMLVCGKVNKGGLPRLPDAEPLILI